MRKQELLEKFWDEQEAAKVNLITEEAIARGDVAIKFDAAWKKLHEEQRAVRAKLLALPDDYEGEMPT